MVELFDERLAPLGTELGSPREPERRSSHVSVRHVDGWRICRALIERARRRARLPRGLDPARPAPPLYTRFVDAWDAVDRLARLVESGEHEQVAAAPAQSPSRRWVQARMSAAAYLPDRIDVATRGRAGLPRLRPLANATQAVIGEGPESADAMFVGEQPGDQEDKEGRRSSGRPGGCSTRRSPRSGSTVRAST